MSFLTNPPAFSSFPDLDPGPSKRKEEPKTRARARTPSPHDKPRKRERKAREPDDGSEGRSRKRRDERRGSSRERRRKHDTARDEDRDRERSRKARRDRGVRPGSREREHKHPRKDRTSGHEAHSVPFEDDERLKAKEDALRKTDTLFDATASSTPGYYSDKRGDPLNVQYGRLDAKQVPNYRHIGGGRFILGLSPGWRVVYRSSKGVEIGKSNEMFGRKLGSLTDPKSRSMLKAPPVQRIMYDERTAAKYREVEGFIRISSKKRPSTPPYKAIEAIPDASDSESDMSVSSSSESSEGDAGPAPMSAYQEKLVELERQAKSNPTSGVAWLALLSHMLSEYPITARNAVKARGQVTESVLSRALASMGTGSQTASLRLRYLQAGEEIWPPERLAEEWKKAVQSGSVDLRLAWLEWRIRRGEGGVDGVLDDAILALASLASEMDRLRVFWRTTIFLRQAGFTERAVALFQAQAELMYRTPASLANAPIGALLDSLEEFWDSEVLRAGEPGAQGWAAWVAAGKHSQETSVDSTRPPETPATSPDPYERWARDELAADRVVRPPLRSTDLAAEIDPYSTILFSDVRPFLFQLTSSRGRNAFRLVWLSFLGLHVPGLPSLLNPQYAETGDDRWTDVHLSSPGLLDAVFPSTSAAHRIAADAQAGVLVGKEEQYGCSFGPVKDWSYRVLGPFEGMDFAPGAGWPLWTATDVRDVDVDLARGVFVACRTGSDDVEWDNLALAFEAAVNVKSAIKLSQSFLANAQDSLPRWTTHARLERMRARPAAARKVYETVLSATFSSTNRLSTGPLWWDWAEMEWLADDAPAARRVILRAAGVGVEGNSGVAVLRAKQAIEETARAIPAVLWKVREAWTRLGALLELLSGANANAGLPAFVIAAGDVDPGAGSEGESRAVAALGMLYHHVVTLRSATKPALLRERLERALAAYPDNTAVLGMYLEMQKGRGVWGRVRDLVGDGEQSEKGVARRVADVWVAGWERGRWEWELERTRAGLEAAVSSERTRGSPVLWRVYLEFEIRAGDLARAKDVFFRAVGQCPLVKELYTVAFARLRSVLSVTELNGLGETMAERGIRTRAGLEEAVEGWAPGGRESDGSGRDSEEEEYSEDEIEYTARETERLKPY